ncbi:MAG: DUF4328 domain-containing protein [Ilumatobacteraceae bacterium]
MSSMPPPPPPMSPPPGYVAYGGPGAAAGAFQSIRGLSKAMVVLLWISVPLQVLALFDLVRLSRAARKFLADTNNPNAEQVFKDAAGKLNFGSLGSLMVLPVAVLTMIWMYRMSANLRKLDRQGQTWAPGWGIAGWFVPPCAIYAVPWLMFRELWRGSNPATAPGDPDWKRTPVSPLITWWWVLYGLVPLLGFFSAAGLAAGIRSGMTIRTFAERLRDYVGVNIALSLVAVAATIVYIQLVRQLSSRHMQSTREA